MVQLSLNVSGLSIPDFIEACRAIIKAMTGNVNFPAPNPKLANITAALDSLEATYQKGLSGDHNSKALQKQQRKDANSLMQQLKVYVQNTSGDDLNMALSSGVAQKAKPQPHNTLDAPQNVRAVSNGKPGGVSVSYDGVRHRTSYLIYQTDPASVSDMSKWVLLGTTGKRSFEVANLTRGTEYAFIVVAVGTGNVQGPPSDPATVMAV